MGNVKTDNFKLVAFVRPQWAQCGGDRQGLPVPLQVSAVSVVRGVRPAGIVPLLSSLSSIEDEEFERMVMADPARMMYDEVIVNPNNNGNKEPTENAEETFIEESNEDTELHTTNSLVHSRDASLSQMLRCTQVEPTLEDTPLAGLKVSTKEVENQSISGYVYLNAKNLYDINYEESKPYFDGLSANWKIPSEFQEGEYNVKIAWPELMPRTVRSWNKTYSLSCSCPGFMEHGPHKFCKHISFIILKHFKK